MPWVTVRVSSREAYIAPDRGAQGNALKTLIAMPFVLDGDQGRVVIDTGGKRIGLFVEDVVGQQQVVIKSLKKNFRQVQGLAGATILGDGSVALILDLAGLIQRYSSHILENEVEETNAVSDKG